MGGRDGLGGSLKVGSAEVLGLDGADLASPLSAPPVGAFSGLDAEGEGGAGVGDFDASVELGPAFYGSLPGSDSGISWNTMPG